MAKIDQIRKMLAADPDDLLLNYALAMELLSANRPDEALAQFDKVIAIDPAYSAAYMQKAKVLIDLARHDDARSVLQAGIAVALACGDLHAKGKMEELLRAVRSIRLASGVAVAPSLLFSASACLSLSFVPILPNLLIPPNLLPILPVTFGREGTDVLAGSREVCCGAQIRQA